MTCLKRSVVAMLLVFGLSTQVFAQATLEDYADAVAAAEAEAVLANAKFDDAMTAQSSMAAVETLYSNLFGSLIIPMEWQTWLTTGDNTAAMARSTGNGHLSGGLMEMLSGVNNLGTAEEAAISAIALADMMTAMGWPTEPDFSQAVSLCETAEGNFSMAGWHYLAAWSHYVVAEEYWQYLYDALEAQAHLRPFYWDAPPSTAPWLP